MDATLETCPKCGMTDGHIAQFRAIQGGICFLCMGAGKVTAAAASRWLASQIRRDFLPARAQGPQAPARPSKTIRLVGFDLVWGADPAFPDDFDFVAGPEHSTEAKIVRLDAAGFRVWVDGMSADFAVVSGVVVLGSVCNGLASPRRKAAIARALQGALKA